MQLSSASMSAKNVPTLRLPPTASCHEARTTIGIRTAISTSMTSAMPSTPKSKPMPNRGIHSDVETYWNRSPSAL